MVSVDLKKRDTIAAPYIVQSTGQWDGVDGNWTSFLIAVGTPPQSFRLFPATIDSVVTVPIPEGCQGQLSVWSSCGNSRGVDTYNGQSSQGFVYQGTGASSTASEFGIFRNYPYQNEYTTDSGPFFTDKLNIARDSSSATSQVNSTVIAGQSSFYFWVGTLGLGGTAANYAPNQIIAPSLLTTLKNQSLIPSLSYAYTAGQYNNNVPGSLILGGYDTARQSTGIVVTPVDYSSGFNKLNIQISSITATGTTDGTSQSTVSTGVVTASVDSSLSHMWLPGDVCDKIASAFGLTYDATTALYLVNSTQHATLKSKNASLRLLIGGDKSSGTTTINMQYNSLDLQAGLPIYSNNTNYFPMKRATNSTQYTLGRVFLQDAYLIVDWERRNFTLGPVVKPTGSSQVVAITTPSAASSSSPAITSSPADNSGGSGGIGGGAIAGIIIGVLAIAAIAIGFFLWRRRKQGRPISFGNRYSRPPPPYENGPEFYGGDKAAEETTTEVKAPAAHLSELYDSSNPRHELTSEHVRKLEDLAQARELNSTPVAELHGDHAGSELDVTSTRTRDSVSSTGSTVRSSVASPTRSSVLSPERGRIDTVFEME